jgi:hypothetical protein
MRDRLRLLPVCTVLAVAATAWTPAPAGVDIDFGMRVDVGDDADLFLAVSSRYFDRDRATITDLGVRYTDPDDLTVSLFLCRHTGADPGRIWNLRRQGLTWWQIGVRLGVPADAWFVPVTRDPGPPYGKAYGHWKKHRRGGPTPAALTDRDLRNLVAVRMLHEYYGVSVEVAMDWRASGESVRTLVAREYRGRHAKAPGHPSRGKGHGKNKSRNKRN